MNKNECVLIGENLIKVSMIRLIKFDFRKYVMKVYAIGLKPFKVRFNYYTDFHNLYCDLLKNFVEI